jgi:hypothetical protein
MNGGEEILQAFSEPFYPKADEVDSSSTAMPHIVSTSQLSTTTGSSTIQAHP